MGKLKLKHEQLVSALDRLVESIEDLENFETQSKKLGIEDTERGYRSLRDSLIQRFELSSDLFWKYLKRYMIDEQKQMVDVNSPKGVIRDAIKAKLLTELDGERLLEMIDDRNMSSHIYEEEIAEQICFRTAGHYKLMRTITEKYAPTQR